MKPIPKSARVIFNAEVALILEPFTPHPDGTVRCMTDCGPLTIRPDPLEHGDTIATVFTRFRDTDNPAFLSRCESLGAARISGKWNTHEHDPEAATRSLVMRLGWVHARALTESEAREWRDHDAAEAAKWGRAMDEVMKHATP